MAPLAWHVFGRFARFARRPTANRPAPVDEAARDSPSGPFAGSPRWQSGPRCALVRRPPCSIDGRTEPMAQLDRQPPVRQAARLRDNCCPAGRARAVRTRQATSNRTRGWRPSISTLADQWLLPAMPTNNATCRPVVAPLDVHRLKRRAGGPIVLRRAFDRNPHRRPRPAVAQRRSRGRSGRRARRTARAAVPLPTTALRWRSTLGHFRARRGTSLAYAARQRR